MAERKLKPIVKCKFKNCVCETREMPREEAVRVGSIYYHKECAKIKDNIALTIELFEKYVNPNPVYVQLKSVINNILFVKKVDSDFLVFALKYYISKRLPLRYPQGLHYVVTDENVIAEYEKIKSKQYKNVKIEITETKEVEFEHKPIKRKGFADILGEE